MALIYPFVIRPYSYPLQIGDVAPQDILASKNLSFQSEILTKEAQSIAEKGISPVYLPTDTTIARNQIEKLNNTLDYIDIVRMDSFGTDVQKIADVQAVETLQLDSEVIQNILKTDDASWALIRADALQVLEQVMRNTIRDDRLRDAQRNVPAYVSFSLSENETDIVIDLVTPFIVPNSLYSEELTNEAILQAVQAVNPVISTYLEGEKIVERGQIISPIVYETLQAFELVQPNSSPRIIISASILVLLAAAYLILYFKYRQIAELQQLSCLLMICILFILFLTGVRLFDPADEFVLYLFPLSAFSLSIAFLYKRDISFGIIPVISIFAAYGMTNSLSLTIYYMLTSLIGVLVLGNGRRIASFFWAGLAVGISGIAVIVSFQLLNSGFDWVEIAPLLGAAFMSGLASAGFTLLFQFLFAQLLGLTTPLRLIDLSRPDHPLLQYLLREIPGTYQHSLQVANLAEQAADVIGADSLLVRVGALYHDAGKAINPTYFIENQMPGMTNPHDNLDPQVSSQIITKHIRDGIYLAKKYRLPVRIQDFIQEHHGTMLTNYQYSIAVQQAGNDPQKVDSDKYRYPGPSPLSKETALLMLADNVEARARAILPKNEEELRELIKKTIDYMNSQGQLSLTDLTLHDLYLIQESFVKTLRNTHHLRLQYPELVNSQATGESNGGTLDSERTVS
ncbi:MAG: HDIG domain-containing protein [Chloroflexi bacterium]|nr:HDIG domain-containing protein [Chloroflexota bacterium]